jgi:hypothetical protein
VIRHDMRKLWRTSYGAAASLMIAGRRRSCTCQRLAASAELTAAGAAQRRGRRGKLQLHGVQGVASSNPAVPTSKNNGLAVKAANPFSLRRRRVLVEDPRPSNLIELVPHVSPRSREQHDPPGLSIAS